MRFRQQFGLSGYIWLTILCFYSFVLFSQSGKSHLPFPVAEIWIFFAALQVASKLFTYWDVESDGLHERRLWNTREVPWDEITRVEPYNPNHPASPSMAIEYARTGPLSDRGQILANPADWDEFLRAMRRFAPHADFEL